MRTLEAQDEIVQKFQWKIQGLEVPLGFAELYGAVRDARGNIILKLAESNFEIADFDNGEFYLKIKRADAEDAKSCEIYGQLPGLQRQMIWKGEVRWA